MTDEEIREKSRQYLLLTKSKNSKSEKEKALREIRRLERLYGIDVCSGYNGDKK